MYSLLIAVVNSDVFADQSDSVFVNVYLRFAPNNEIVDRINQFDVMLNKNNIFSQYQLTPFIQKHPIHITLYLTHYKRTQLAHIIKHVAEIAQHTQLMNIKVKKIETNPSMYTMLFIDNNNSLQQLSNEIVLRLMPFRDKQAQIPLWANQDKNKQYSFSHFGSPNVFENYSPHFSLFAAEHLTPAEATSLTATLVPLIKNFNNTHTKAIEAPPIAIGIGLANAQGQIVKELQSFTIG